MLHVLPRRLHRVPLLPEDEGQPGLVDEPHWGVDADGDGAARLAVNGGNSDLEEERAVLGVRHSNLAKENAKL